VVRRWGGAGVSGGAGAGRAGGVRSSALAALSGGTELGCSPVRAGRDEGRRCFTMAICEGEAPK